MVAKKVRDKTSAFLNSYDYRKTRSIRKALRAFLKLESSAEFLGNEGAAIILADIKAGLNMDRRSNSILTQDQKMAIYHCLIHDRPIKETALEMGITVEQVDRLITSGVRTIRDYLTSGEMSKKVFSKEEEDRLIDLYNQGYYNVEIAGILGKSPRQIKYKIRNLINSGKLVKLDKRGRNPRS